MLKTKSLPRYNVGDKVRVHSGVSDPDYDDLTIGGWAGTVAEAQRERPPTFLVRWSEETLNLEPDEGGPLEFEQAANIVTKPLSMDDQDDRIRTVFGLTSDDPLPDSDDESLLVYYEYLAANLSFPFEAKYSFDSGPFQLKTYSITVLGLLDPDAFPGDEYGLFCQARRDRERIELPLIEVELRKGKPNRRLVADYSYWFVNW